MVEKGNNLCACFGFKPGFNANAAFCRTGHNNSICFSARRKPARSNSVTAKLPGCVMFLCTKVYVLLKFLFLLCPAVVGFLYTVHAGNLINLQIVFVKQSG